MPRLGRLLLGTLLLGGALVACNAPSAPPTSTAAAPSAAPSVSAAPCTVPSASTVPSAHAAAYVRPDYPGGKCGAHEPRTDFLCKTNADCEICHDGSDCGVVVDLATYLKRGDACKKEDAAECEYAWPACVEERCVVCGSLAE